jgi:hypothetical protein
MKKIETVMDLRNAIQQLEDKQAIEWPKLKVQFLGFVETLTPSNLMKTAFKKIISEPVLKTTVGNAVLNLTTGFIVSRIFPGKVIGPLARLIAGTVVGMASTMKGFKQAVAIK